MVTFVDGCRMQLYSTTMYDTLWLCCTTIDLHFVTIELHSATIELYFATIELHFARIELHFATETYSWAMFRHKKPQKLIKTNKNSRKLTRTNTNQYKLIEPHKNPQNLTKSHIHSQLCHLIPHSLTIGSRLALICCCWEMQSHTES